MWDLSSLKAEPWAVWRGLHTSALGNHGEAEWHEAFFSCQGLLKSVVPEHLSSIRFENDLQPGYLTESCNKILLNIIDD